MVTIQTSLSRSADDPHGRLSTTSDDKVTSRNGRDFLWKWIYALRHKSHVKFHPIASSVEHLNSLENISPVKFEGRRHTPAAPVADRTELRRQSRDQRQRVSPSASVISASTESTSNESNLPTSSDSVEDANYAQHVVSMRLRSLGKSPAANQLTEDW